MAAGSDDWETKVRSRPSASRLTLDVGGFEGPLDLLLELARQQKVDLGRISILEVAEAYLAFVRDAQGLCVALAGDYLIMAADLALLRAKLLWASARRLCGQEDDAETAAAEDLAKTKKLQLQRLAEIQAAAAALLSRKRLGWDVFPRGDPSERPTSSRGPGKGGDVELTLVELVIAYARLVEKKIVAAPLAVKREVVMALADGLRMLRDRLMEELGWRSLFEHIPETWRATPGRKRSAVAATFVASLELAKRGELIIRQDRPFGPIEIRRAETT